ncbi:MAG: hypothetical protein HKM04_07955, partial [Legionellales bacterium]|nr:hypothetical protein [Legionellales bacterium]
MMRYSELQSEIAQGESSTIEFKKSTGELSEAMESLCGFLNYQGGVVYIGVKDNREIVGQTVADTTKREIARHLREIEPTHNCEVIYVPIPKTAYQVIVIKTDHHAHDKPFVYKGRPFYRQETTTSVMSQRMYQKLLAEKQQLIEWDSRPAKEYSLDDLSRERVTAAMQYILNHRKIEPKTQKIDGQSLFLDALSRLHLMYKNIPTNGAMILFGESLSPINYGQSLLKLACFADQHKNMFLDSKQEYGNLFVLLEKAESFIYQHTGVASHFEGGKLQRIDTPDYPYMAIREALINAFCHRDYSHNQGYVSVEIYPDKLGSVDNWFFGCKKSVIGKNWFLFSLNSLLFAS